MAQVRSSSTGMQRMIFFRHDYRESILILTLEFPCFSSCVLLYTTIKSRKRFLEPLNCPRRDYLESSWLGRWLDGWFSGESLDEAVLLYNINSMALQDRFELKCVCSGLNDQLNPITCSARLAVEQLNECQTVSTWTMYPLGYENIKWTGDSCARENAFAASSQAVFWLRAF